VVEGEVEEEVEEEVGEEVEEEVEVEEDKLREDKPPQVEDPSCWEQNLPTSPEIDEMSIDLWPI
jgi:hypothetical protein